MNSINEEKTRIKFLVIGDMHSRIQNVRKTISKLKSEKFDYILSCGDIVNIPTGENEIKILLNHLCH